MYAGLRTSKTLHKKPCCIGPGLCGPSEKRLLALRYISPLLETYNCGKSFIVIIGHSRSESEAYCPAL
jgi:hypothetical protein